MMNFASLRLPSLLLVTGLVIGLGGCNRDGLVSMEGQVTIDGKPAPAGIALSFNPVNGGSPSYGETDENGHFVAAFTHRRFGIVRGEHSVRLVPGGGGASAGKMPAPGEKEVSDPSASLPRIYYEEIMKITVDSGSNQVEIPLESTKSGKEG